MTSPATLKPGPRSQVFCWYNLAPVHWQKQITSLDGVEWGHPTEVISPLTQPRLHRKSTEQQQPSGAESSTPSYVSCSRLGRQRFLQKTNEARWQQKGGEREAGSQCKDLCWARQHGLQAAAAWASTGTCKEDMAWEAEWLRVGEKAACPGDGAKRRRREWDPAEGRLVERHPLSSDTFVM